MKRKIREREKEWDSWDRLKSTGQCRIVPHAEVGWGTLNTKKKEKK